MNRKVILEAAVAVVVIMALGIGVSSGFSLARTEWFEAAAGTATWKALPLRPEAWLWAIDGRRCGARREG